MPLVRTQEQDDAAAGEATAQPWYAAHPSEIEAIDLIENLPFNLGMAVKLIWRCDRGASADPRRDLQTAHWYTQRELLRIDTYDLDDDPKPKTHVVWRALARKVRNADREGLLADFLDELLEDSFTEMMEAINHAIRELDKPAKEAT